jgi:hypothetical protein
LELVTWEGDANRRAAFARRALKVNQLNGQPVHTAEDSTEKRTARMVPEDVAEKNGRTVLTRSLL